MIDVKKEGVILRQTSLEFENDSVLNPAVMQEGNKLFMFYRAVRKGNFSTIGFCTLDAPFKVTSRLGQPFLSPEEDYEMHGMEDPRIVKIDDLYYLTYIAFDGTCALGALATSKSLENFERQGIIVPKIFYDDFDRLTKGNAVLNKKYLSYNAGAKVLMDKDLVFFPRRINGKLTFLHRIKPDIQITAINDLSDLTESFWEDYFKNLEHNIFLMPEYTHEASYVGGGCPPVETDKGWLIIYHGVKLTPKGGFEYSCCAALMDINNPQKELGRLPYPLFKPELDFELKGDVDNVCFPTGTAIIDDTLYIYYGAADELIACASVSLSGLVNELLINNSKVG